MGIRIKTNIAALNAQRQLYNSTLAVSKSMEKISSGLRVNRSGDDAAGLASSESLKSDIRALGQAGRNASDGISMVQTAEGALDEVSGILIRMKELAIQSITGTLGAQERTYLNQEYSNLRDEITRISNSAEFNGIGLLNGLGGLRGIQVGIGTALTDQVVVDLSNDLDWMGLGLSMSILDPGIATTSLAQVDLAAQQVLEVRSSFGAAQNRLESSIRNIALAAENLSAANSRIRDVDVALETSNLASMQVLQQAGISILSQANLTTQLALGLLQQ